MLEAKVELVPPKQRWNLFRHSKNLQFQAIRQTKFDQFALKTIAIHFNPKSAINMALRTTFLVKGGVFSKVKVES